MERQPITTSKLIEKFFIIVLTGLWSWACFGMPGYSTCSSCDVPVVSYLWGVIMACVTILLMIDLCDNVLYRRKYMKQNMLKDGINSFNTSNSHPRWFELTSGFKTIRNSNGRVIRITKIGPRRVCSVDEHGRFHIAIRDWFIEDDFIPGRYIVSKTTGKLTFVYLKKNYT